MSDSRGQVRPRRARAALLGAVLVAFALAGCAGSQGGEAQPTQMQTSDPETTESPDAGERSTGDDVTGGRFLSVDDTGLPPSPIEDSWLLAVPAAEARELLGDPQNDHWAHHAADVDRDAVIAAGGLFEPTGPGGRFELPVEPGTWLVCRTGDRGGSGTWGTGGCAEIEIADGDRLLATFGEGGFWIGLDD